MKKQVLTRIIVTIALVAFLSLWFAPSISASEETISIETANASINNAFVNVLEAKKAGGNVTDLLIRLDTAGDLLAKAENTLKSGSTANVTASAESARQIANQINDDAIKLRNSSLAPSEFNNWITIAFSAIGVTVFTIVLLVVWKLFKRRYMNRLLGMKPEVITDAP